MVLQNKYIDQNNEKIIGGGYNNSINYSSVSYVKLTEFQADSLEFG